MEIYHVAETVKGGVATCLQSLVVYQSKSKLISMVNVVVPGSQVGELDFSDGDLSKINIITFPGKKRAQRIFFLSMKIFSLRVLLNASVLHLHSTFAGLVGRIFNKGSGATIFYQPHGVAFDEDKNPGPLQKIIKLIEVFLSRKTSRIISISADEQGKIIRAGILNVDLVENGVPDSNISYKKLSEREGFYLFVGRFDKQKGFDLLCEKWQSDWGRLVAVGDFVLEGKRFDIPSCIDAVGWTKSSEIDWYYANAKALIVPSRWEGFGLVVAESYRNGTPVIASDRGALPDLVDNDVTGYLLDIDDVANSLPAVLIKLNRADWGEVSSQCLAAYKLRFSSLKMNEKVLNLYFKFF